jgi:hypothetical protein
MNCINQIGKSLVKPFAVVPFRVDFAHFQISLHQECLIGEILVRGGVAKYYALLPKFP